MEFVFWYLSSLIFSFLLFVVLHKLVGLRSKSTLMNNLPPGPPRFPLIGNLLHLVFSSDPPHRILRNLSNKYGPLMHLKLGEITTLVISSAEYAKHVMKTHDTIFASRPSFIAADAFVYGGTDIAFSPYGKYWTQLRKICTSELLSTKRVHSFAPLRVREISHLCRWISSKEGSIINLTKKAGLTTYDIVTQASIGKKTDIQALFISLTKQAVELVSGFNLADLYPSIKLLSTIGGMNKKIKKVHQELDIILEKIIHEHKLSSVAPKIDRDEGKNPEDLLDVLLKFQNDPEMPLTNDNVKAVLMDMFTAGIESSAATIDWAMAELLKNPRIMKAAQSEVRRVFDANGYVVDESCFDQLIYLKLVIKEALRLHPPAPLLVPRESREHCEIVGYQIPIKTRVIVNAWAIGRDPKYWVDPECFQPERFLEKSVDYKGNDFDYIPFGAGRRICPGMTFGVATVELVKS